MTMAQKYKIEGDIDFYSMLNAPLSDDDADGAGVSASASVSDSDLCLITQMKLTADHVQMQCGHKFNYLPLYNDLVQHLKWPSSHRTNYITCPFCRHSQITLLPFNALYKRVIGVNFYPFKISKDMSTISPKMGSSCKFSGLNECTTDYAYKTSLGSYYCEAHHMMGVSDEKQQANHSAFLLKKQIADNKLATKKAKQELLANKKLLKAIVKCNAFTKCSVLVKSGPRIGQICGSKAVNSLACARHSPKI